MAMTKIKGLQQWCRKMTEGYPNVDISNFTTAWRNGMAFCAIIHRFRPDLIDFDSLSPENVFENNKLAFEVGESELNIPAFLEADDMARLKVPDKLSVITYVSQYYNYLHQLPQLGGPGVKGAVKKSISVGTKRPPEITKVSNDEPSSKKTVSSKNETNVTSTTASPPKKSSAGDKCNICQNKVYLLERHIEGGKLYHRSCFRHSELSPTNKVFTKSPFMSPSLNNEKATPETFHTNTKVKDKKCTPSNEVHLNHGDFSNKKGSDSAVLADLKSGLKRVEGVGSKHSIQGDKEEEPKKAKVQPRTLFGSKENIDTTTEHRVQESVFPLSGKEAKKLERRRQEILSSESSTPISKGGKRGMPLIFQNTDKSEPVSSHITTSSENKKSSPSSYIKSSVIRQNASTTGVQNTQNKLYSVTESKDSANQSQPVAKPRVTGSKVASSPFMDTSSNRKDDSGTSSVTMRNNAAMPKAAPRKSVSENVDKTKVMDRLKNSPNVSYSSLESSSADEMSTPRSPHSVSSSCSPPPALPLSPPPSLPSSKPPLLPTSPPPPVPPSSSHLTTNHVSHFNKSSSKTATSSSSKPISPTLTHKEPLATLVTPVEKNDDSAVLSNLLASLAGVRGRSSSTPGSNFIGASPTAKTASTTNNSAIPKIVTTSKAVSTSNTSVSSTVMSLSNRKQSEPAVKLSPFNLTISTVNNDENVNKKPSQSVVSTKITANPITIQSQQVSKSDTPEAMNILKSLKNVSQGNDFTKQDITPTGKERPKPKTRVTEEVQPLKSKSTVRENQSKVGNLKNNYLSKSKEDLSSGYPAKVGIESKSEDIFKKPLKPAYAKDKDQLKDSKPNASSTPKMSPRAINVSCEDLTNIKDVQLKSVQSQSKPHDFPTKTLTGLGVKLSKVETPTREFGEKDQTQSLEMGKIDLKGKKESSDSNMPKSDSDVPQWKKDIEKRKKKLREDIARSESPSRWTDKHVKEKLSSDNHVSSDTRKPRAATTPSNSEELLRSDLFASKSNVVSSHNVSESTGNKLEWQKEAERRMASFAQFDSEDERQSQDEDRKVEGKLRKANENRNAELKKGDKYKSNETKLKDVHISKQNVILKPVDIIDISIDDIPEDKGDKKVMGLSKPLSLNNNNNIALKVGGKKTRRAPSPPWNEIKNKAPNDDGKVLLENDLNKEKQPSPKVKRKVTVFEGGKNKDVLPPTSLDLSEKKKIAVTSQFDFDATTPSDIESSLTQSTDQLTISDDHTPYRPPRTRSKRHKGGSPKQISAIELQQQLMEIDNRLTDLELRGRDLEDSIRNASIQEGSEGVDDDDDRLMMEWFQLVSDKNDLVRREADLVYLSREQELEDEQEQIDSQLRYLMTKDEMAMSPQEKEEEAYLLQRKIDIVNQRSSIVDSMDEDRIRYEEEDKGIEIVLKSKGLWKDDGTLLAEKGKKVAKSKFYT